MIDERDLAKSLPQVYYFADFLRSPKDALFVYLYLRDTSSAPPKGHPMGVVPRAYPPSTLSLHSFPHLIPTVASTQPTLHHLLFSTITQSRIW